MELNNWERVLNRCISFKISVMKSSIQADIQRASCLEMKWKKLHVRFFRVYCLTTEHWGNQIMVIFSLKQQRCCCQDPVFPSVHLANRQNKLAGLSLSISILDIYGFDDTQWKGLLILYTAVKFGFRSTESFLCFVGPYLQQLWTALHKLCKLVP